MSGTTPICLQQQFHNATHEPLVGGLLYSRQAGTLIPQNAFRTAALTVGTEYPNPVTLDASGRVPLMFYADGLVRLILTDKNGVAQFDYDNVPVIGSSGGGPASDTTDVTRLFSTGDMKLKYGIGPLDGYVIGNGLSIGNVGSPATQAASAAYQAIFQYFWNRDPGLLLAPGGRGVTAIDDWNALKAIGTPDFRGMSIGGLDGMGAGRSGRLQFANGDTLHLAFDGLELRPILKQNLPNYTLDVSIPAGQGAHGHPGSTSGTSSQGISTTPAIAINVERAGGTRALDIANAALPAMIGTAATGGSGTGLSVVQPTRLVTVYFRI